MTQDQTHKTDIQEINEKQSRKQSGACQRRKDSRPKKKSEDMEHHLFKTIFLTILSVIVVFKIALWISDGN